MFRDPHANQNRFFVSTSVNKPKDTDGCLFWGGFKGKPKEIGVFPRTIWPALELSWRLGQGRHDLLDQGLLLFVRHCGGLNLQKLRVFSLLFIFIFFGGEVVFIRYLLFRGTPKLAGFPSGFPLNPTKLGRTKKMEKGVQSHKKGAPISETPPKRNRSLSKTRIHTGLLGGWLEIRIPCPSRVWMGVHPVYRLFPSQIVGLSGIATVVYRTAKTKTAKKSKPPPKPQQGTMGWDRFAKSGFSFLTSTHPRDARSTRGPGNFEVRRSSEAARRRGGLSKSRQFQMVLT